MKKKAIKKYKKRQKKLQKLAVSLGGKREDIVSLPFNLSEGDIISPICLADCPEKIKLQKISSSTDTITKRRPKMLSMNFGLTVWQICKN